MSRLLKATEQAMAMDEAAWARHANPWSVWTRVAILPLAALVLWSRIWLGWATLVPLAALLLWVWVNPRAFPPPRHTGRWESKATFGERVLLNRAAVPIPAHHRRAAAILGVAAGLGLVPLAWGLWVLDAWAVGFGLLLTVGGKLWFLDRMVWLYDDMSPDVPAYRAWLR